LRIIAGEWRGRRIHAPPGSDTRPTADRVREAWMSVIAAELPGARVLDLFAGSGALGLEALSRGAESATFVEQSPAALRTLQANLASLAAQERTRIVRTEAMRFVRGLDAGEYDVALADPPYGRSFARSLAKAFAERPFAGLLCIEHGPDDLDDVPPGAQTRSYGDTRLTLIPAS
jgi:16S rRNA (guanine966-N2)-methyltransferase